MNNDLELLIHLPSPALTAGIIRVYHYALVVVGGGDGGWYP